MSSKDFRRILERLGYCGDAVYAGVLSGRSVQDKSLSAIVQSTVGKTEEGGDKDHLLAVILDGKNPNALATALCCSRAISSILKPLALVKKEDDKEQARA